MSGSPPAERGRAGRGHTGRASESPTGPAARVTGLPLNTIPAEIGAPVPGTFGTPIVLHTNQIEWRSKVPEAIAYHVVFEEPAVEQVSLRRRLIRMLRERDPPVIPSAFVYDGDANIKTTEEISDLEAPFTVEYSGTNYRIRIIRTGTVSMGSPEMLRLYNTQSRVNLRHMGFVQIGRDYYNPNNSLQLNVANVSLWFGMDTSVNSYADNKQLMVVNSISKVVRRETPFDVMSGFRKHLPTFQSNTSKFLINRIVLTTYNNRHYRIADIDYESNPLSTFPYTNKSTGETTQISYKDYVKKQYNIDVRNTQQPLLVGTISARDRRAGKTDPPKLIPECCILTGIRDIIGDTSLRREMITATKKTPSQRVQDIRAFMQRCMNTPQIVEDMNNWGLSFAPSLTTVPGRVLEPEKVTFANGATVDAVDDRSIDNAFRNNRMVQSVAINNWLVICTTQDQDAVNNWLMTFNNKCRSIGLNLARPAIIALPTNRVNQYIEAINRVGNECQLVMPFLSRATETDTYSAIKKLLCVQKPIPSQVIVTRNATDQRRSASIATKVAIQVNCKLGGIPWTLAMPSPIKLMVCGYDVHHDSHLRKSVGAFVSSLNESLTQWFSRVHFNDRFEELSTHFASDMKDALEAFKQARGSYPDKIVLYRDGVSEGQIRHVHEIEKKQILDAINEKSPIQTINLAIVIVTKRVAARFFIKRDNSTDYLNPGPGTIADAVIRRANSYDFFLISQNVRDGSVTPVNYNIIADTTGWKLGNHQRLAYKLCHVYFNWTGTVKVPAPCQYAHKLSFLVGTYIHAPPHEALSKRLYFL